MRVMLERACGVAALGEADGEVVVRRGVGGIFLDRRPVMRDGLVEPAEAVKRMRINWRMPSSRFSQAGK